MRRSNLIVFAAFSAMVGLAGAKPPAHVRIHTIPNLAASRTRHQGSSTSSRSKLPKRHAPEPAVRSAITPVAAPADEARRTPKPKGSSAVMKIDGLHTEIAILNEELQVVKLRQEIAKATGASGARPAGNTPRDSSSVAPPAGVVLPSVKSISGIGRSLGAELVYPDGSVLNVRAGGVLSDGSRVTRISKEGVVVHTASGVRALPMYTPPTPGESSRNSAAMPLVAPPLEPRPPSVDSTSNSPRRPGGGGNGNGSGQ